MISRRKRLGIVGWMVLAVAGAPALGAGDPTPEQRTFFEQRVRPLLADQCFKCHGESKQKGGLRLDSLEAILHGGDSGPAVVPGNPAESLLVEAIKHEGLAMPPTGKLGDDQIRTLTRWIEQGAPWPGAGHASTKAPPPPRWELTAEDRSYWFFQPLRATGVPELPEDGWSRNPIDRFILLKLRSEGLAPAPEADPYTLIRRLSFDLTGLPPTPEESAAFAAAVGNDPEGALDQLVERLLASPRYGERWGRHWLDLVRYAESDGHRADGYRPHAWPYRDYVIRSFNADKPYDRFLVEQLAGDELDPDDPELRVATEYYRLGTYEHNQRDVPAQRANILYDIADTTGEVILGLGFGCARCHDHKFDPILQEDYYKLLAFFVPLQWRDDLYLARATEVADYGVARAVWQMATADVRDRIAAVERPARAASARTVLAKFPPATQAILTKPEAERTPYERQIAYLGERQYEDEGGKIETLLKGEAKQQWLALQQELSEYDWLKPPEPLRAFTATDVGPVAPPNVIPGDRHARDIPPGTLAVLSRELGQLPEIVPRPNSTGRRSALAAWITRPDNPMTARVLVNRVWQYHFGRGLVATSSDFGRLGEPPSHPELLDWLAGAFVARGWRLKELHRLIVTSATYRQASRVSPSEAALLKDPENRWLWRMNPRRLEAEPIRDASLAVSGELRHRLGGPAVEAGQPVRTIYTKATRNTRDELLEVFDAPDASLSTAQRNATVTPTQSLLLINGPWLLARARAFAARLEAVPDVAGRIRLAYQLAYGRPPEPAEESAARGFLARQVAAASEAVWVDFCHALLNSNEFLYVD